MPTRNSKPSEGKERPVSLEVIDLGSAAFWPSTRDTMAVEGLREVPSRSQSFKAHIYGRFLHTDNKWKSWLPSSVGYSSSPVSELEADVFSLEEVWENRRTLSLLGFSYP